MIDPFVIYGLVLSLAAFLAAFANAMRERPDLAFGLALFGALALWLTWFLHTSPA